MRDDLSMGNKLRKLTIQWSMPDQSQWKWGVWGDFIAPDTNSLRDTRRPGILNDPLPPVINNNITRSIHEPTLDDIYASDLWTMQPFEELEQEIRHALQIDEHEPLDTADRSLLMRAWEAQNEPFVKRMVWKIASELPALEEFDWWFGIVMPGVLWSWRIVREASNADVQDQKSRVRTVVGSLSWFGCLQGDPTPLHIVVGEQLEFLKDEAEGVYRDL